MKRILPPLDFTPVLVTPTKHQARQKRDFDLAQDIFRNLPIGVPVIFRKKGTYASTTYVKTSETTLAINTGFGGVNRPGAELKLISAGRPGDTSIERAFMNQGVHWMLRLEKLARKNVLSAHSDKIREQKKRYAGEIRRHFDLLQVSTNF